MPVLAASTKMSGGSSKTGPTFWRGISRGITCSTTWPNSSLQCEREESESTARALFETLCLAKEREIAKAVKKFVGTDPAQVVSEFAAPRPTNEPNNEGKTPIEIAEGEDELSCANFELAEWIRERTETRH